MPMYDFQCVDTGCGTVFEALRPVGTKTAKCPECRGVAERVWITRPANIIGDECDIIQENGFAEPQHFRSKAERRRALKEVGCEEAVRHVGVPGSDKSPHTTSWASIGPETLDNARRMLERVGGVGIDNSEREAEELDDAVHTGQVGVELEVEPGRKLGLHIGSVYRGVLDPSVLKGAE